MRLIFILLVVFGLPRLALADVTGPAQVVDGDTLDVGGVRVRLFGIDAPEHDQTCLDGAGAEWACGRWVTAQLRSMVKGRALRCAPIDTDRYGRTVARCFLGDDDLAQTLVDGGLAFAYRAYSLDYDLAEKSAAIAGRGLHSSTLQRPSAYRKAKAVTAVTPSGAAPAGCVIKGNISGQGARIFHSPGQRDYDRTRVNTAKGERWFCTPAQARAAGWRAARR